MHTTGVPPQSGKNSGILVVNRDAQIRVGKMKLDTEDVRERKLAPNAVCYGLVPIRKTGEELLNHLFHLRGCHQIRRAVGSQAEEGDRVFGLLVSCAACQQTDSQSQ